MTRPIDKATYRLRTGEGKLSSLKAHLCFPAPWCPEGSVLLASVSEGLPPCTGTLEIPPKRTSKGRGRRCAVPALVYTHHAAVVLVPSVVIEHPRMDDVSDGHFQVVGEEILQELQGLVPCRLQPRRKRGWGIRYAPSAVPSNRQSSIPNKAVSAEP